MLRTRLVRSWQIHVAILSLPPSFSLPLPFSLLFLPPSFISPSLLLPTPFFPLSLPSDPVTTVQVATRRCCLGIQTHDAERSRHWAQYSLHPPAEVCQPWSRSTVLPDVLPGPYAAHIFCCNRHFTYRKCVHNSSLGPRPKTNPSADHFQYHALYWKWYTRRMRSGYETNTVHTVKQKVFLFKKNCSSSFRIKKFCIPRFCRVMCFRFIIHWTRFDSKSYDISSPLVCLSNAYLQLWFGIFTHSDYNYTQWL